LYPKGYRGFESLSLRHSAARRCGWSERASGVGRLAALDGLGANPSPCGGALTPRTRERLAGAAALAAGASWFAWALINSTTRGALELSPPGSVALALTLGWTLLLIPAVLRTHSALQPSAPKTLPVFTAAGVTSPVLWALGAGVGFVPHLEIAYNALAAVWLLGTGAILFSRRRSLGIFALVVGGFTALDAVFGLFEPMPFALYLLAAPKLPLAAIWSVALGVALMRHRL
jgi:hypothetical protein